MTQETTLVFAPRRSAGCLWPLTVAMIAAVGGFAVPILAWLAPHGRVAAEQMPLPLLLLITSLAAVVALFALVLAASVPLMRYELGADALILTCGPLLKYRIRLSEIRSYRRRNLTPSVWPEFCLPGLALFTVHYGDAGHVKMCSTSAARRITLIKTDDATYGLDPSDEQGFSDALKARLGITDEEWPEIIPAPGAETGLDTSALET